MTILSKDNSGTAMSSRTYTDNQVSFSGKKYGLSSYLLTFKDIKPGEYGIVLNNPNDRDEKKVVVSCLGVD